MCLKAWRFSLEVWKIKLMICPQSSRAKTVYNDTLRGRPLLNYNTTPWVSILNKTEQNKQTKKNTFHFSTNSIPSVTLLWTIMWEWVCFLCIISSSHFEMPIFLLHAIRLHHFQDAVRILQYFVSTHRDSKLKLHDLSCLTHTDVCPHTYVCEFGCCQQCIV